ncbi:MAG: hypothetical protein ACTSPB_04630 [Candidatus Thorarchaeota archaeon]
MLPELQLGLSFLFVFAVVYGVLATADIFKGQKGVNTILALVIAAFSVLYGPVADWLVSVMPIGVIIFIVLFAIQLIRKIIIKKEDYGSTMLILGALILVLAYVQDFIKVDALKDFLWIGVLIIVLAMFWLSYTKGG